MKKTSEIKNIEATNTIMDILSFDLQSMAKFYPNLRYYSSEFDLSVTIDVRKSAKDIVLDVFMQ